MSRRKYARSLTLFLAATATVLSFQNCGQPSELEFEPSTSSAAGVQNGAINLLINKCSSCHNPSNAQGGINDITDVQYLLYSRLVIAGEPEISPIIEEVSQGQMPPPPNASLTGAEVSMLKDWITTMAPQSTDPTATPPPSTLAPKYSILAAQIFVPKCVTCHQNKNYKLNTLAEVLRTVTAGNSAASLLYRAITTGANGGKMPQGGALSAAEIQAVKDWIDAGALNN